MKRMIALALCAVLALGILSGCGGQKAGAGKNRLDEILERGYITVATEPYFAPNEFIDPSKEGDDRVVGADIELAKLIAQELGVECRIIPLDFTTVLSSVTEGKYDLAISALAFTPDRAENMNLSNAYFVGAEEDDNTYGFAMAAGLEGSVRGLEDLADKVVVLQQGSLQQFLWEQSGATCKELKYVSSTNDAFLMVSTGKADAAITATAFARLYIEANPDSGIVMCEDFRFDVDDKYTGTVMGMKKGEDELLARINEIIADVVETGVFAQWYSEYKEYAGNLGLM